MQRARTHKKLGWDLNKFARVAGFVLNLICPGRWCLWKHPMHLGGVWRHWINSQVACWRQGLNDWMRDTNIPLLFYLFVFLTKMRLCVRDGGKWKIYLGHSSWSDSTKYFKIVWKFKSRPTFSNHIKKFNNDIITLFFLFSVVSLNC